MTEPIIFISSWELLFIYGLIVGVPVDAAVAIDRWRQGRRGGGR